MKRNLIKEILMCLSTYVYVKNLHSNRYAKKVWQRVRLLLLRLLGDKSECRMMAHGYRLYMSLSHMLPYYLNDLPFYDSLPRRIASFVVSNYGYLNCIDVGANIGDTVAAFKASEVDTSSSWFLAIEPDPTFRKYLQMNWGNDPTVKILSFLCSSSEGMAQAVINENNGTASISIGTSSDGNRGSNLQMRTIDRLVCEHKISAGYNVIKIDTDGHDCEVIWGAESVLRQYRPFVLFEVDNFDAVDYTDKLQKTFDTFVTAGYKRFILYDNNGYMVGMFSLANLMGFYELLFYKFTSRLRYFDALFIDDERIDAFFAKEMEVFIGNPEISPADSIAAQIIAQKLSANIGVQ